MGNIDFAICRLARSRIRQIEAIIKEHDHDRF